LLFVLGHYLTSTVFCLPRLASLYDKLEYAIMPMFYRHPAQYAAVMRSSIAINGEFFSAQRMMSQYYRNVYQLSGEGFTT
jgi:glucan phosphorylase